MASLLAFQKEPLAFQVDIGTSAFAADSFQIDAFQILWDGAFQIDGDIPDPVVPPAPVPGAGGGSGGFVGGRWWLTSAKPAEISQEARDKAWAERLAQDEMTEARERKRAQALREDEEIAAAVCAMVHAGIFDEAA